MNKVWVFSDNKRVTDYIINNNIEIFDSKIVKNKTIYKINISDYELLSKYKYLNVKIYSLSRIRLFKNRLNNNKLNIFLIIFYIILIIFLSNIIVDIDINNSNKELSSILQYELKTKGLKRLTLSKRYDQLINIKEQIRKENKETIDWIEIRRSGMKYIINFEERKLPKSVNNNKHCNVVAKKEGIIISSSIYKGTGLKDPNDLVKKGDVLISGELYYKDKLVKKVCASGDVYANTWYKIQVNVPIYKEKTEKTNKNQYNILLKYQGQEYQIFKSKFKNKEIKDYLLFKIFGLRIYIRKETKVKINKIKQNEEELINLGVKKGLEALDITVNENLEILDQKVLKKSINNSKMYIELFISLRENISEKQVIE